MYKRWRYQGRSFDLGRMTVRDLVLAYASHPAVHLYLACSFACLVVAIRHSAGMVPSLAAGVATLAAYPIAWYLLHRFVLHGRWLWRFRATAPLWRRIHFDHHQDPHRMDVLFGAPSTTLPTILAISAPLGWFLGGGLGGAAASVCTGLVVTCIYEFSHCIQHLNFKPRSRLLRRMKELHLMHHFHDEHGNFGITSFVVDRALGTYYASPRERARSAHVFDLGYDLDEAGRYPWVARLAGGPPLAHPPRYQRQAAGRAG